MIGNKEYPGRLILIGQEKTSGKVLAAYAITGRSISSQSRKMVREKDAIWVKPTDKNLLKTKNIDLLIYPSVFFLSHGIAVSNGKQTIDIMACLGQSQSPAEILAFALKAWDYEPDEPAFTPRISGCVLSNKMAALSLIRKTPHSSSLRNYYEFSLVPGKGKMIMTYQGENRDPLPSFMGEPQDVEIDGSTPQEVAEAVYASLGPRKGGKDFRVAAACVFGIDMPSLKYDTCIVNKAERK